MGYKKCDREKRERERERERDRERGEDARCGGDTAYITNKQFLLPNRTVNKLLIR